jgi:hypothetical protein
MMRTWKLRLAVLLSSVLFASAIAEVGLRLIMPASNDGSVGVPQYLRCDGCGRIYEGNPEHPEISRQGLRRREYAIPKPAGTYRILFLGDSVVFGSQVPFDTTFIHLLETKFASDGRAIEAINAGAEGYTTYNEVHYYLERGRRFEADLVILGFCLNDVVDPLLHWTQTRRTAFHVPEEAIPDLERHTTTVLPRYRTEQRRKWLSERSALLRLLDERLLRRIERRLRSDLEPQVLGVEIDGERWPTFLSPEDDVGIQVLTDYDSHEWRWLRRMLAKLQSAVTEDGAELAIIVFPLAYQLDDEYPYLPQEQWNEFCRESSLEYLDLLPALRAWDKAHVYQLGRSGYPDVWHFSPEGHLVVSELVREFLEERYLRNAHAPPSAPRAFSPAKGLTP